MGITHNFSAIAAIIFQLVDQTGCTESAGKSLKYYPAIRNFQPKFSGRRF